MKHTQETDFEEIREIVHRTNREALTFTKYVRLYFVLVLVFALFACIVVPMGCLYRQLACGPTESEEAHFEELEKKFEIQRKIEEDTKPEMEARQKEECGMACPPGSTVMPGCSCLVHSKCNTKCPRGTKRTGVCECGDIAVATCQFLPCLMRQFSNHEFYANIFVMPLLTVLVSWLNSF